MVWNCGKGSIGSKTSGYRLAESEGSAILSDPLPTVWLP